jgi:hypothetical protein
MKHFIAYHNTEKMGYSLPDSQPQRLLAKKPIKHLLRNTAWFVTFEGSGTPRQYCLGSVFRVGEVQEKDKEGFKWVASGPGYVFHPRILIKDMGLRFTGNFGLGVSEVKDNAVIVGLTRIAE